MKFENKSISIESLIYMLFRLNYDNNAHLGIYVINDAKDLTKSFLL